MGDYHVLYFATLLDGCFGETLARLRPSPALVELARADWESSGFMPPGAVPAEWRQRRLAVRVTAPADARFLDVEHPDTHRVLERTPLGSVLPVLGLTEIDVSAIRGGDRRLTRLISYWAYQQRDEHGEPLYGGIRYLSRLNSDWECWAVFDRTPLVELERHPIRRTMAALTRVAKHYGLDIF
jgi:hypothetical protein